LVSDKGLFLQLEWPPGLSSARQGAQQKIHQALINLLGNAIKFSEGVNVWLKVMPLEEERLRFEAMDRAALVSPRRSNSGYLRPSARWMRAILVNTATPVWGWPSASSSCWAWADR